MQIEKINIAFLLPNDGQIVGLPANPRFIREPKYEKLKQSIIDDPEMLELRELIVIPYAKYYIILGGNMRFRACRELGYTEMICKVISTNTPIEKLRAIVIKDNVGYGENDMEMLANEWDNIELEHWGMDVWVDKMTTPKEQSDSDSVSQNVCKECGQTIKDK